jgi:hypothetical protein
MFASINLLRPSSRKIKYVVKLRGGEREVGVAAERPKGDNWISGVGDERGGVDELLDWVREGRVSFVEVVGGRYIRR